MPIKIKSICFVMVFWCLSSWQPLHSAVIEDLYDAKIAVLDQSSKAQSAAFNLAMKQVLVKVRGNKDILTSDQIRKAITKPTGYIRSYSYDSQDSQLFIDVNFEPKRLEALIRNAGFPIWDKRRPDTLVWLVTESDNGTKEIVTAENYPDWFAALHQQGQLRGVTFTEPLWDLDDRQALNVYDVWGGFTLNLNQASERYGVKSVLSARIYQQKSEDEPLQANTTWLADWTMLGDGKLLAGQVSGNDTTIVVERLVDDLADNLALKYAVDLASINPNENKIQLTFNNIKSLKDYASVLDFLEGLSVVSHGMLIKQVGETATFELALLGAEEDLKTVLKLDRHVQSVVDEFGQPVAEWEFFWVK
ncbi:DUF2066 domain-containing protein [Paraglaciecola sp. 2405UD69-4]|uniref:DUF2066 domain-containing protein n=1 Tax=Paraglaciecola sp. 2405UD69-4 TaxID=3391836 RepID=UPI0039C9D02A